MPAAESQIRINTLLLEREALFVRVHELEHAASAILGEPFPFTRPPLPSDKRSKKKRKPAKATDSKIKIRKLESGETAYRVTYRQGEEVLTENHDAPEPLTTLLATQGPQLQVQSIETLDETGDPVAQLHG